MRICDRCKKADPMFSNIYIAGAAHDMCKKCFDEYHKMEEDIFNLMEVEFMKNKILKHVDCQWEAK